MPPSAGATREFRFSIEKATADRRTAGWIAGGLVTATVGLVAVAGGDLPALAITGGVAAVLGGAVWGLTATVGHRARQDRSIRLRIDPSGLGVPAQVARTIPWSAIERVGFRRYRNGSVLLCVAIRDPAAYGLKGGSRWLSGVNRLLAGGQLVVATDPLEGTPGDILNAIRAASPETRIEANYEVV